MGKGTFGRNYINFAMGGGPAAFEGPLDIPTIKPPKEPDPEEEERRLADRARRQRIRSRGGFGIGDTDFSGGVSGLGGTFVPSVLGG